MHDAVDEAHELLRQRAVEAAIDGYASLNRQALEIVAAEDAVLAEDKPSFALRRRRKSSMWLAVEAVHIATRTPGVRPLAITATPPRGVLMSFEVDSADAVYANAVAVRCPVLVDLVNQRGIGFAGAPAQARAAARRAAAPLPL